MLAIMSPIPGFLSSNTLLPIPQVNYPFGAIGPKLLPGTTSQGQRHNPPVQLRRAYLNNNNIGFRMLVHNVLFLDVFRVLGTTIKVQFAIITPSLLVDHHLLTVPKGS